MNIVDAAKRRFATKKFNPEKCINDADFAQICELLRFSPSSVNSQPWHFIIAKTPQGKARIAKGAEQPYAANFPKIMDASHVILFCAKTQMSDEDLQKVTDQEVADGRFPNAQAAETAMQVRRFYADLHRKDWHDVPCWTERQVYLNIGTVLLGAAALGIDAVPIEGVDLDMLTAEFGLAERGYKASAVVALGYHADDDFNSKLPKSRLPQAELFTFLD